MNELKVEYGILTRSIEVLKYLDSNSSTFPVKPRYYFGKFIRQAEEKVKEWFSTVNGIRESTGFTKAIKDYAMKHAEEKGIPLTQTVEIESFEDFKETEEYESLSKSVVELVEEAEKQTVTFNIPLIPLSALEKVEGLSSAQLEQIEWLLDIEK